MRRALLLLPLVGCTSPAEAAPQTEKVTLASVGLENSSLDRSVDPCVDFYQFACGGWLKSSPIPADRARWSRGSEVDERNKVAIRQLLEDAAKGTDASTKKLGDFYASCMDEPGIEAAGTRPVDALLQKTLKVKDAKSWLVAVGELHKASVWVLWYEGAYPDFKDSTSYVMYVDSEGLGLPDRDYYVKPELADKLAGYKVHVGRMIGLGAPSLAPKGNAETAANDVIAIETELAKVTKTVEAKRDVDKAYNPTDAKGLAKSLKIDWKAYWKSVGYDAGKKIVVGSPAYFTALDKLRTKFKPAQWQAYFTYHVLAKNAFNLPRAYDDQMFELDKLVRGVESRPERAKRCIDATREGLGELLGQAYVSRYFPSSAKQTALAMIDALAKAMGNEIAKIDWMTDATKQVAQGKLAKIARMVGYPDKWRTYDFDVKRDDFGGNRQRAAAFELHRTNTRAGKPVDRSEWYLQAYDVDAYYDTTMNTAVLPAGILQAPFFGADRSVAANLGGIGMVIGHELTHGFDDQGAKFDASGNLKNWWSTDDVTHFQERGTCVADQYSTFEAAKGQFVNGKQTLGENIADMGGVKMAFNAYRALRANASKVFVADGFTEDQQYFLAVAQAWCSKDRPSELQRQLTTDEHAPPTFRVFGSLRNLREFATAFKCAAGTPMNPAKSCSVW